LLRGQWEATATRKSVWAGTGGSSASGSLILLELEGGAGGRSASGSLTLLELKGGTGGRPVGESIVR
jgi:hypothetical protein